MKKLLPNKWLEKSKEELIGLLVKFMVTFGITILISIGGHVWGFFTLRTTQKHDTRVTHERDSLKVMCNPKICK